VEAQRYQSNAYPPSSCPDVAVCPEGRVSPVEEESTQIVVDRSGS
jgi:hypothetical protein